MAYFPRAVGPAMHCPLASCLPPSGSQHLLGIPFYHSSSSASSSAYCGARHLDGDDDMRRPSVPECKAATAGLIEAFSDFWFKEKAAPVAL
jgi:hypothetical protein